MQGIESASKNKKKQLPRRIRIVLAVCLLDLLLLLGAAGFIYSYLNTSMRLPTNGAYWEINPGASLKQNSQLLARSGYIHFPDLLVIYARLSGQTNIKTGEYFLPAGITPAQLLKLFNEGKVRQYQVTLIEGSTVKQVLSELSQQEKLDIQLAGKSPEQIRESLGIEEEHLEGLFFPDTYFYVKDQSDISLLKQSYMRLHQVLREEWEQRATSLPYKNSYEALIMASIVEKETGVAEERPEIAGVFVRRLQKGMRLQTDPSVIYGLGEEYQGNLQRKHLQQEGPYNTYTRSGLPPTPIALAGREAIHAALHPAEGDYLYFVAMGDGRHYFSATLEEHEQAVRQYQLTRKKDYHSVPKAKPEVPAEIK
jgi:UPF0755 protein